MANSNARSTQTHRILILREVPTERERDIYIHVYVYVYVYAHFPIISAFQIEKIISLWKAILWFSGQFHISDDGPDEK